MDKQREEFEKSGYDMCSTKGGNWDVWQAAQSAMQPEIETLQVENKCLSDSCREVTIKYRDTKFHLSEAVKNYADIFNQLSAANQRITELLDLVEVVERCNKQLEATLNQVRSTYNQIIAEDTATRNEYLDEIAKLEERICVADAEEPVLFMFTVDGRYYTAKNKAHAESMLRHPDTYLYPDKPEDFPLSPLYLHAQIPAEVAPSSDIVPDRYCKQSKCANTTTGCVGHCRLDEVIAGQSVTVTLQPHEPPRGNYNPKG